MGNFCLLPIFCSVNLSLYKKNASRIKAILVMHTSCPVLHVADNEFGEVLQVGQGGGWKDDVGSTRFGCMIAAAGVSCLTYKLFSTFGILPSGCLIHCSLSHVFLCCAEVSVVHYWSTPAKSTS